MVSNIDGTSNLLLRCGLLDRLYWLWVVKLWLALIDGTGYGLVSCSQCHLVRLIELSVGCRAMAGFI